MYGGTVVTINAGGKTYNNVQVELLGRSLTDKGGLTLAVRNLTVPRTKIARPKNG